jgi:nucleoside-diphosphate-sugar epimerase
MPRILIAGCGYLGQATADLLLVRGWEVEGWTKSAEAAQNLAFKPYSVRAVDISDASQVSTCTGQFDAVIHCASTRGGDVDLYRQVYLEGLRNLLNRFGGSSILFVSSTSVYAQTGGEWATEESPAEPKHATGKILREAEQLALEHNAIVARLAGIYGPGRSHLLKSFLAGEALIDPENDRFTNQTHRDDAAAAVVLLLEQPSARREIFNVVDDEPILRSECYRWLAEKLNRPSASIARSTSTGKRGRGNKLVSNAKLRSLGWVPRYPTFVDGMEKSVLPSFGL